MCAVDTIKTRLHTCTELLTDAAFYLEDLNQKGIVPRGMFDGDIGDLNLSGVIDQLHTMMATIDEQYTVWAVHNGHEVEKMLLWCVIQNRDLSKHLSVPLLEASEDELKSVILEQTKEK